MKNRAKTVKEAVARFPKEFGLANHSSKNRYSISEAASFDAGEEGILLYVYVWDEAAGQWLAFVKGTEAELMKELVVFADHPLPIPVKTESNGRVDFHDYVDWICEEVRSISSPKPELDKTTATHLWERELTENADKFRSAMLDHVIGKQQITKAFGPISTGCGIPLRSVKVTRILEGEEQNARVICDPKRPLREQTFWKRATLAEGEFKYKGGTRRAELRVEVSTVEGVEGGLRLGWHLVEEDDTRRSIELCWIETSDGVEEIEARVMSFDEAKTELVRLVSPEMFKGGGRPEFRTVYVDSSTRAVHCLAVFAAGENTRDELIERIARAREPFDLKDMDRRGELV